MPSPTPPPLRRFRRALSAAMIGVLLFASGIVANLLSSDIEERFKYIAGYTMWLWIAGGAWYLGIEL